MSTILIGVENFDDSRITAMGLLVEASEGVGAKLSPTLARYDLSSADFNVVIRLGRSSGRRLRMTDLAAQTSLSTSGITRVVDRLEGRGLVRREACPEDRRASYAVLTPDGMDRLREVLPAHVAEIEEWFTGLLTPDQLDAMLAALRVVRDAVRPCATADSRPEQARSD